MQKEFTTRIAAMYLGGDCEFEWLVDSPEHLPIERKKGNKDQNYISVRRLGWMELGYIKAVPKLRRLETLTEEEARHLYRFKFGVNFPFPSALIWLNNPMTPDRLTELKYGVGSTDIWLWLLSKGFDLFGLIDSGLAIEIK